MRREKTLKRNWGSRREKERGREKERENGGDDENDQGRGGVGAGEDAPWDYEARWWGG